MRYPALRVWLRLLLPSSSGLLCYAALSGLLAVLHSQESIRQSLYVPPDTSIDVGHGILSTINNALVALLGQHANTLVLGMLWGTVGLFIYMLVHGSVNLANELSQDVKARHYVWSVGSNRNEPLESFGERLCIRLAAFIALVLYIVYPMSFITTWEAGGIFAWQQWLARHSVVGFVFLFLVSCAVWHGLTIILRVLALRTRLFG